MSFSLEPGNVGTKWLLSVLKIFSAG